MSKVKRDWIHQDPGIDGIDWAEETAIALLREKTERTDKVLKSFFREINDLWDSFQEGKTDNIQLRKNLDYIIARFKGKVRADDPRSFRQLHEDLSGAHAEMDEESVSHVENFVDLCMLLEDHYNIGTTGGEIAE